MSLTLLVIAVASITVVVCCVFLVLHPQYETGFVGGIALSMLGVAAFARFSTVLEWEENEIYINPSELTALLWIAVAVYFFRQVVMFLRRYYKRHSDPKWRKAVK